MQVRSLSALLALFPPSACGSSRSHEVAAPANGSPAPLVGRSDDGGRYAPAESRASAPAADSRGNMKSAMPSGYRPGLATTWGETRGSEVHTAWFERQSSEPSDWARVQYDDELGVRAVLGGSYLRPHEHIVSLLGGALLASIVDDDNDALPSVQVGSATYVIAEQGERYQIRVENRSSTRFEIVASVDGLDVLDGRPGGFEKRGYIVAPYSSLLIEGFRMSDAQVAAFRFGSVGESYADARGAAENVGVIGIAAFAERYSSFGPHPQEEVYRRQNAEPFPSRYATPPGY